MDEHPREKWDSHYRQAILQVPAAAVVLSRYLHFLPAGGRALDLACGRGANAMLLSHLGFDTEAWDISSVATDELQAQAQSQQLVLLACCRDVVVSPPSENSFDVIVVSRFLHRELAPALIAALRPGGFLYYQTFVQRFDTQGSQHQTVKKGPSNPAYLLRKNELLSLFDTLTIRAYSDQGAQEAGSPETCFEAMLVGQKN